MLFNFSFVKHKENNPRYFYVFLHQYHILTYQFLLLFSHSVTSDSLRPHRLQYVRIPYPSPYPGAISNSCPLTVMPSNHLILCCFLLLPPSIFPSIRVFSSESVLHIKRPNHWSFSFSISPSNEYSGLISFKMDRLDLLALQGTLKREHQFFSTQLSL